MLTEGTKVRVKGLVTATQHNGKVGIVTKSAAADGRVAVKLEDGGKRLAVRVENLEVLLVLGVIGKSSEAAADDARRAWREVLPVVDDASPPPLPGGRQSLVTLGLEKEASSVRNMEEFNEIVKSDESGTMDSLLRQRSITPEVCHYSDNPVYFFPQAVHMELGSDGGHIATILSSQDKGTVRCTFNADATKCCYAKYSPLNFDQKQLDAMVGEEPENYADNNGFDFAKVYTNVESLWVRTGGALRVSDGFLVVLHHTDPPTIRPLVPDDELPNHARMLLPRVVCDDSTYAILEPCEIQPDDDDCSTWGCAGTQPPPMLVHLDILTGKCHAYEFERSEQRQGSISKALDYEIFERYGYGAFPMKYRLNFIEVVESSEGNTCIIMSVHARYNWNNECTLLYHGRLVEEETGYGDTISIVVWTCMCRAPSLSHPSSAVCMATGAVAMAAQSHQGVYENRTQYDPEKHNYCDYALVHSAFDTSAPGWSSPCHRLPILLQCWTVGAAALAFSGDGKKLFAFGYDMGFPWAELNAQEKKFIDVEVQKRLGEKQEGEVGPSYEERRKLKDEAYELWRSSDDDSKRMKLKVYCRDI